DGDREAPRVLGVFTRSARFYDAIYSFKDYGKEAARIDALIRERRPNARTLLDVACGTGLHLKHLSERYEVEGLDLDPELLKLASDRLGGCTPARGRHARLRPWPPL